MKAVRPRFFCAAMLLAMAVRLGEGAPQRGDQISPGAHDSSTDCATDSCRQQDELPRAAALIQQAKNGFVAALVQFAQVIAGRRGDDGLALPALVDAMAAQLARWDDAIRRYETALLPAAASVDAMVARAAVHLDRANTKAALKEIDVASRLAPGRHDVFLLKALAHDRAGELAESARAFERAAAIAPREPAPLYGLAQARVRLGDEAGSRDALQTFDERFGQTESRATAPASESPFAKLALVRPVAGSAPSFPPALYGEAFTLLAGGSYDDAVARIRDALARDPLRANAGDDALMEASARIERGDLAGAMVLLESRIEGDDRSERRRLLAAVYAAADQIERSIEHLEAAVRLAPDDERSRLALADLYISAGRDTEAERLLGETLELVPHSAQAPYRLGQLYQSLNRYADALGAFEAAAARSRPLIGQEQLYRLIGVLRLQEGDIDGAMAAHREAIVMNPNDVEAHRILGDVYARAGRYEEGLAEFAAALLIRPLDALTHAARAQAYLTMGDYARAERSARRAVELDPAHVAARYALGAALARLGKVEEAALELERFRKLQAAEVEADRRELEIKLLQQSAWASAERGDYADAAARLQQAVALRPDSADAHLSLGVILKRAARYEHSLSALTRAVELGATGDVQRHLAEVYRALGRIEQARSAEQLYQRAKAARLRDSR